GAWLVGGSAVAFGAGGVLFAMSSATARDASAAPSETVFAQRLDRARSQRALALAGLGVGAGLLTAGGVRLVLASPRRHADANVSVTIEPRGAVLVVQGNLE